jgi:hypothetical protein
VASPRQHTEEEPRPGKCCSGAHAQQQNSDQTEFAKEFDAGEVQAVVKRTVLGFREHGKSAIAAVNGVVAKQNPSNKFRFKMSWRNGAN